MLEELDGAPDDVKELLKQLRGNSAQRVPVTETAHELALKYIENQVLPERCYSDALHVALATLSGADFIISWNFKHLVNVDRIAGFNAVNESLKLKRIDIRPPTELMQDE